MEVGIVNHCLKLSPVSRPAAAETACLAEQRPQGVGVLQMHVEAAHTECRCGCVSAAGQC